MFKTVLTFKQTDMMKHAWGFHTKNPGFRTHYCCELDNADMVHMITEGFFKEPIGVGTVGENCGIFHLSDKGIEQLKKLKVIEDEMKAHR